MKLALSCGCLAVLLVATGMGYSMAGEESPGGPYFIRSAEPVARRSVSIEVEEPSDADRSQWPVRGGIPIPRGELRDASKVRLLDAAGKEVPVQTEVLGWWPTIDRKERKAPRSVMWLCLTFLADVKAGHKAAFELEYGTEVTARARPKQPIEVKRGEDVVALSNGLVSLALTKNEKFIRQIAVDGKAIVTGGNTSMSTDHSFKPGFMDAMPVKALPAQPEAPTIDGDLGDAAWGKARRIQLDRFQLSGKPRYPTDVNAYISDDKQHLYLAFRCQDPDPSGIQAPERKRDSIGIRQDDHVEIWLGPSNTAAPQSIFKIAISASGAVRDQFEVRSWKMWTKVGPIEGITDGNIDELKVATRKTEQGWQAEVEIPLTPLRLNYPWFNKAKWDWNLFALHDKQRHEGTFGLMLYRYRPSREGKSGGEETRWPFSLSYSDFRPGKFAHIPDPTSGRKDDDDLERRKLKTETRDARVEVREIQVEVEGPVVSIARVRGIYRHDEEFGSPFTCRVHLYGDRKDVRLFHTMTTGFKTHAARMKQVSLNLPCPIKDALVLGMVGGKTLDAEPGSELMQYRHDAYARFADERSQMLTGRLSGWCRARTRDVPLTLAPRYFWELHPGGIHVTEKGLRLDFYSPRARPFFFGVTGECREEYGGFSNKPHEGPQRVSRTHEVWLDFSGSDAAAYGKAARRNLLPFAGKKWNCDSLAMGLVAPHERDLLPRVEDYCDYQYWWWVNEQEQQNWYGWADFGNTLNSLTGRGVRRGTKNPFVRGYVRRGGYGWANDRKCITLSFLTQYFRSGRRVWFDFGETSARSSMDVCTTYPVLSDEKPYAPWSKNGVCNEKCNHAREDKVEPYRKLAFRPICAPRRHTYLTWHSPRGSAARQGGQPGWVVYHFLTGDRRAKDVIEMRDLFLTTKGHSCWNGGGMCTSSMHGTRAQERRFLLLRWTMTDDPLYPKLLDAYHRNVYAKMLTEGSAAIVCRYPWYVEPDKIWMWAAKKEAPPGWSSFKKKGISGMHVELGGWEMPVRYCQLTGDPWLAQVLYVFSGPAPSCPDLSKKAKGRNPTSQWSYGSLFRNAYGPPIPTEADLLQWTGNTGYLVRLTGCRSDADLKTGLLSKSPVEPALPEKCVEALDLYTKSVKFGWFPPGYLWPSGAYYRAFAILPLQQLIKTGKPWPDLKRLNLEPIMDRQRKIITHDSRQASPDWKPVYEWAIDITKQPALPK